MSLDHNRATFVKSEYRYSISQDLAVQSLFPAAKEVIIETQLLATDADTYAAALLADTKTAAQSFEVEIEGLISLDDFEGGVPRYTVSFPQYSTDSRVFKLVAATIDYGANTTRLRLRG